METTAALVGVDVEVRSDRPVISDTSVVSPRGASIELLAEDWPEDGAKDLCIYRLAKAWNGWVSEAAQLTRRGQQSGPEHGTEPKRERGPLPSPAAVLVWVPAMHE